MDLRTLDPVYISGNGKGGEDFVVVAAADLPFPHITFHLVQRMNSILELVGGSGTRGWSGKGNKQKPHPLFFYYWIHLLDQKPFCEYKGTIWIPPKVTH